MSWNQKHITARWEEISGKYTSEAKHQLTDRYTKRGIINREIRVSNANRRTHRLIRGPLLAAKRYNRREIIKYINQVNQYGTF